MTVRWTGVEFNFRLAVKESAFDDEIFPPLAQVCNLCPDRTTGQQPLQQSTQTHTFTPK